MRNLSRWKMAVHQVPGLVALLVAAVHAPAFGQELLKTSAAASFYEAACGTEASSGNALACYRLGELYWEGRSVAQDKPRAAKLYQKACDRSDLEPRACLRLAGLYERGEAVPKVPHRALTLYRMACDAGDREACSRSTSLQASLGLAAPVAPPPVPQAAPPAPQVETPAPAPTEYDDSEEATEAKIASFNAHFEEQKRKATTQEERDRIEKSRQTTEKLFRLTAQASRLERQIKAGNEKLKSLTKRADENTEAMRRNQEEQEQINKTLEKYAP